MNRSTVKLGSIYNIGIGNNEDADAIVIGIERSESNGDQAILQLIDFGSPLHKQYVSSLENKQSIERDVDFSEFNFSRGEFDATDSLRNFIERTEKEAIEAENKEQIISEILESGAKYVTTSISNEACATSIAIRDIKNADFFPDNFEWSEKSTGLDEEDY